MTWLTSLMLVTSRAARNDSPRLNSDISTKIGTTSTQRHVMTSNGGATRTTTNMTPIAGTKVRTLRSVTDSGSAARGNDSTWMSLRLPVTALDPSVRARAVYWNRKIPMTR